MKTLLVVAAEQFELKDLQNDARLVKVARGPGPQLAKLAMEETTEHVDAVVSVGICGALDEALQLGDILVATDVNGLPVNQPQTDGRHTRGSILSVDRVIDSPEEKRKLRETGAIAVEMEAAAVVAWARERQLPVYCVRAVSDLAGERFGLDLNAARDTDGRFSRAHILAQVARRPQRLVPELRALKRNSELAARALGDFFAHCHF